jgi:hypothetical protein
MIKIALLIVFAVCGQSLNEKEVELLKPKLNSERIAYFFGSYGVEVLPSSREDVRISNLYSVHEGKKITRTLAVTVFKDPIPAELLEVHGEIMRGKSIGSALKEKGFRVEKKSVYFGSVDLNDEVRSMMRVVEKKAALHVYELFACSISYCTIMEVHSPEYLDENWLKALYPREFSSCSDSSHLFENFRHFFSRS